VVLAGERADRGVVEEAACLRACHELVDQQRARLLDGVPSRLDARVARTHPRGERQHEVGRQRGRMDVAQRLPLGQIAQP
jgi:hypothetical protein